MKSIIAFFLLVNITAFGQDSSPVQLKWSSSYPVVDSSNNYLTADSKNTVVDKDGNFYLLVSVISDEFPFYRFKLTKYNSFGIILWQVKSNTIESNNYVADIVEIDNNNNIYVVAHTFENNVPGGLLILKFNANGNMVWQQKYNGSLINSFASPIEIKFDNYSNVVLLGYAGRVENNIAKNDSLLIIKYSSSGIRVWTATTNNDSIIYKAHCEIDGSNNIIVTGESMVFSHRIRFAKYDNMGRNIWSSSYFDKNYYYTAIDLTINTNGQLFVVGNSSTLNFNSKWITIMFDKNCQQRWVRYEDKDSSSDVYETPLLINKDNNSINVLGYENKNNVSNFFLIKYDTSGNKLSDRSYIDTTVEYVQRVIVDNFGNLYTAGFFQNPDKIYLIKFDNRGNKVWNTNFLSGGIKGIDNGMNLVLDNAGYIFLTTEDSSKKAGINEVITSQYEINSGKENWTVRSNEYLQHQVTSMLQDNNRNTYLTGWIENGKGINKDFLTIKYDSEGKIIWSNRYYGPAHSTDIPNAIAVDNDGNIYVTGESYGMNSNLDFATIKYNSNGEEEWRVRYDGGSIDKSQAIAVNADGYIYVSGSSIGEGSDYDFTTIKYNKFGQLQWIKRYNDLNNGKDSVVSMVIDNLGNIYVAGTSHSTNSLYTFAVIKYNSDGTLLWTQRYHKNGNEWEKVKKMIIDKKNNVYVTGIGFRNDTKDDIITVKFNTDGIFQWGVSWNDPGNSSDEAADIKVDKEGNVYVAGYGAGGGTDNDFITLKYDSSGNQKWAVTYDGSQNSDDFAVSLALDYQQNSYVEGFSFNNGRYDYSVVKYDTNGVKLWDEDFPSDASSNSVPIGLSIDSYGNILIGGYNGNSSWSVFNLIEYSQQGFIPDGISELSNKVVSYQLYQNFPNPFNPITTIKYSIPKRSLVSINLYDLLGRKIKTLMEKVEDAGNHELRFDGSKLSSGVYFYTMYTEYFMETKKMIILK